MSGKFCVLCGRQNVELIDSLCVDCYIKTKKLIEVPRKISGKYCKICGAQWVKGKWVRSSKTSLTSVVEDIIIRELGENVEINKNVDEFAFDVKNIWKDPSGHSFATIEFRGKIRGKPFSQEAIINLEMERVLCDSCFRKKTRYYEAIVQLRSKSKIGIDDKKRAFFESFFSTDIIDNISDIIEGKEGVDYYFMSKSTARKLITMISSIVNVEVNESYQNERMKNGKREAKLVISLRI
ncbi:NMD3-related protein [Sulfolobus tengchongensis]|uniref:NMD3-related protein n=1 Tax=Sulfolobus tengchongensis TaxID=207809 RepID=A0AAX4L2I1_9CREN